MLNTRNLVTAFYLIAVVVSIFMGFDFKGSIDLGWTLALIILTLPLSLVSILFAWALIHGAGLEFFAWMYLTFAVVNVACIHTIIKCSRKPHPAAADNQQENEFLQ
jgi:hypothetical protein